MTRRNLFGLLPLSFMRPKKSVAAYMDKGWLVPSDSFAIVHNDYTIPRDLAAQLGRAARMRHLEAVKEAFKKIEPSIPSE